MRVETKGVSNLSTGLGSCIDLIPNLIWIVPIAGGALSVLGARTSDSVRNAIAVGSGLIAALLATFLFFIPQFSSYALTGAILDDSTLCGTPATWIQVLGLNAGVLIDPLTAVLAVTVSWVSFLILFYSLGYMKGEKNLTRYYFLMTFFIGNMLLLVMSDNFLQLFLGWEGVGYCSYALIGFWHTDESKYWVGTLGEKTAGVPESYSPSQAGLKAFIMTRAGDIAFLIGILMIFAYSGTFNFYQLSQMLSKNPNWASNLSNVGLFIPSAILIFGGAIGKSAQFPLHEWLPDAMAGPTSVSALIHAATMVNAGVFLVGTVGPLYFQAFHSLQIVYPFFVAVAGIGAFTALLAASQAMVLDELKKVLAYSTISQIGYMMLGLGVAGLSVPGNFSYGFTAGFFHLISQALFKAGLFMCAGWLIHATGSKFMSEMGGLGKNMKITFVSMLIVALSLAGIFPLSGFWSKESILGAALQAGGISIVFYGLGLVTALMTAFYSMRFIGLIFAGEKSKNIKELEEKGEHIHEAPSTMWVPYSILAGATVVVGLAAPIFLQQGLGSLFSNYLKFFGISSVYSFSIPNDIVSLSVGLLVAIIGVAIAYAAYFRHSISPAAIIASSPITSGAYMFFKHRWYINALYYKVFVYPVINGSNWLFRNFEEKVIDPINYGAPEFGGNVSTLLRKIQTGIEEEYVFAFGVGIVLLVALLVLFSHII
jgi:NADH-quinone oxidoreductase subunit L